MNPSENPEPHSEHLPVFGFGEYELRLPDETLWRGGERLNVNRRTFQVLRLLIDRRGEIVTKEEFFEKVWGGSFVEDNNLTVAITALRKILGDNAKHARFIENIPRKGYRFVAPVSVIEKAADNGPAINEKTSEATPFRDPEPLNTPQDKKNSRPTLWVLSACVVAALAFVVFGFNRFWPASSLTSKRIESIAVLPFADHTNGNEYLADGLTDGVTGSLSRLPGLRVVDRNSADRYKNKDIDAKAVGGELNVRSILTGQVAQDGDLLIIDASLTDAATNELLWRQQFRHRTNEVFDAQQEIARLVAGVLRPGSNKPDQDVLSKRPTNDPEAYDLYLKGRYYWNKRLGTELQKSIEMFRAAIDRDPTFAKAYIGLADAYTLGGNFSHDENVALSRGAVRRALEIDDTLGEAYASMAINKCYYDWNFAGAESDYRKAVELSPNDATSHHWYAEFLSMQGRFDESRAEYEKALSLDPLSLPIRTDMAFSYYYARDYDKALELLKQARQIDPEYGLTYNFLMFTYREKGMFLEATDAYERYINSQYSPDERSGKAYDNVIRHIASIKNEGPNLNAERYWKAELEFEDDSAPIFKAVAYSKLGDADNAFIYLEKAFKGRFSGMVWLKVTPDLDNIRSDPRYDDLLRRVGFAQ